ncbi:MAG: hypothetical protein GF384_06345 [Elusimicrobia bacterium]|nr:hypothetical protein [Elusimicrobiota bacterium]MBD3412335.1 hypothetical protein [Elusimicrobiota bacterium]
MNQYYADPFIQKRIREYIGVSAHNTAGALYLSRCVTNIFEPSEKKHIAGLSYFFRNGFEICRSLWDRNSLIAHLDIEYVNFDFPAEPHRMYSKCSGTWAECPSILHAGTVSDMNR